MITTCYLRGTPCREMRFHNNLLLRPQSESVKTLTKFPNCGSGFPRHCDYRNHYSSPDPTNDLAVGDFDGDGVDDIFVGTGVAWYFSSGGRAEWRFLNRMPERASELLFGDFDGDGRTDVMALHNGVIDVSWAGGSRWQSINVTAWSLSDLAVGDFDGDGNDDCSSPRARSGSARRAARTGRRSQSRASAARTWPSATSLAATRSPTCSAA